MTTNTPETTMHQGPGAPPTQPESIDIPIKRSTWPTVIGLLSIIGSVFSIISILYYCEFDSEAPITVKTIQGGTAWDRVLPFVSIIIALLWLFGGIGFILRRRIAFNIIRIWAVMFFVRTGIGSYYAVIGLREDVSQLGLNSAVIYGSFALVVGIICLVPLLMLIWLTRQQCRDEISSWP